jgi:multimeric flavodoxin WrbA
MNTQLILHDLPQNRIEALLPRSADHITIFSADPAVRPCVGCFGCWLKTPGECVIEDRGKGFAALIAKHDEFLIISRMVFGGLSPAVKAVFDRSIGHMLPFFHVTNDEMHHVMRSKKKFALRYVLYGYGAPASEGDKEIAHRLVAANALNFGAEEYSVQFCPSIDEIEVAR